MTHARRRIVSRFVRAGATAPERAIAVGFDDHATLRLLRDMRRHGAVAEAAPGRYWLDPEQLARFRGSVRRRIAAALGASGLAVAAAAAFGLAE